MKIYLSFVMLLFCSMTSVPALAQHSNLPVFFQFSYGQSFFRSNSSPGYTYVCPEVKLGLGITKERNRFGVSTGAVVGIRYGTTKELPYQVFVSEARMYMQIQERYYSSAFEFLEIPITAHYKLVEDRLSIHAGISTRWYFTESYVATGLQGFLENIPMDRFNMGILTMVKFNATPRISVSIDYFLGLKKLNVSRSLQQDWTYHTTGSFAQVSLFINLFKPGKKD